MMGPQEPCSSSLDAQSHVSHVAVKLIASVGREQWTQCV